VPDKPKRSKKAANSPNKVVPIHEGAGPVRATLDDTDLAIVRALQANARATYTEIGKAVGLSAASVHERVHRLETRGVIRGYHAEVDPERLGLGVLSLVSVLPSDSMDQAATEAALATVPEVETAYSVAGEDSHLLVVRTRSIAELSDVLQRLQGIDGVARTRTAVVLGFDFSQEMLKRARSTGGATSAPPDPPEPRLRLAAGDALALPLADASVDVVTIAFGLRNLPEPGQGLLEFRRVLRPGGRLVVCEFSTPVVPVFRDVYRRYLTRLMPVAARRLTSDPEAYQYLARSIGAWPDQPGLARWIQDAGFGRVAWRDLTGGIVALHRGVAR
jgi:ubiquinone/menaquinone biosynthesis methyltransferase